MRLRPELRRAPSRILKRRGVVVVVVIVDINGDGTGCKKLVRGVGVFFRLLLHGLRLANERVLEKEKMQKTALLWLPRRCEPRRPSRHHPLPHTITHHRRRRTSRLTLPSSRAISR